MTKILDVNPLTAEMQDAAAALWGKPLAAKMIEAIASVEQVNKCLMQFLDMAPVTQAMQWAVAYGWALRERAEMDKRRIV